MNINDFTFGLEIECYLPVGMSHPQAAAAVEARIGRAVIAENWNHITRPHWKVTTDGSLNDYIRGAEFVSPVLRGEAGLAEVHAVMAALTAIGCELQTPTNKNRCGLHVHVGGFPPSDGFFKNLMKLYAAFEPVIDGFMAPSRRDNRWCRSLTSIAFSSIDRARGMPGLLALMARNNRQGTRYHKLNLVAFQAHGTVEFRQHGGTLEGLKATQWIGFCCAMVQAAIDGRTPTTPLADAVPQMNRAPEGSKAWRVGQMLLRPEGVTGPEAMAALGWPSISLPQQAGICGLSFTKIRTGRMIRYYARVSGAGLGRITLATVFETLRLDGVQRAFFEARTARFAGTQTVAIAA